MLIRCSALRAAMTEPKKGSKCPLSETAKKIVEDEIRFEYFGVRQQIYSKEMQKGIDCEQQSIDLLNFVEFSNYVKNTERRTNQWLTGECDIFDAQTKLIRDIKTSWSIATFPLFLTECNDYEWQMRGYMWLWDADTASVDYCLVDTPEHLIGYEQRELHVVSGIDEFKRIRSFVFERDLDKEALIKQRCEQLQEYYQQLKTRYL